jgi:hypothetical protein
MQEHVNSNSNLSIESARILGHNSLVNLDATIWERTVPFQPPSLFFLQGKIKILDLEGTEFPERWAFIVGRENVFQDKV